MRPLISVIIPVYNIEDYLEECIQSVRKQTYENFELLLIDDGSTDLSGSICDKYSKIDSRVKVFHEKNGGASSARNKGLAYLSPESKYIFCMDDDDFLSEDALMRSYSAMTENNVDMVVFPFVRVDTDGSVIENPGEGYFTDSVCTVGEIIQKSVEYNGWMYRLLWNKLYPRDLFDGVKFPDHKTHEDEWVAYRLLLKCKRIACISTPLYFYRKTPGSIMASRYSEKNMVLIEAHLTNSRLLAENGYVYAAKKIFFRAAFEYAHACYELKKVNKDLRNQYREVNRYLYEIKAIPLSIHCSFNIIARIPRLVYLPLIAVKRLRLIGKH